MIYKGETKRYECENGNVYHMPSTHCVFCKNCSDLFYDYTNGPYLFMCDLNKECNITETSCECDGFDDSGYIFDEAEYLERKKKEADLRKQFAERLESDPEFKNEYETMMDRLMNAVINGRV